jgi:hypothetical protein
MQESAFYSKESAVPAQAFSKHDTPFTVGCQRGLSCRIYPDNRPKNLEISALQKGVILMADNVELIEEGAGFGVPIAKCADHTYFSSTALVHACHISRQEAFVRKTFVLDAVSSKQFHRVYVNRDVYELFNQAFEQVYLNGRQLRPLLNWSMQLQKMLGLQTKFIKIQPLGAVVVTYHFQASQINIHADFSGLKRNACQTILLLNEQGASTFRRYSDSGGTRLIDGAISPWAQVKANEASFSNLNRSLGFTLESKDNTLLVRGREQIADRFSWAGLSYSLPPTINCFEYDVTLKT